MMKNPIIISVQRSHFLFFQSIPNEGRYSKKVKNMSKELPTPKVFYEAALRLRPFLCPDSEMTKQHQNFIKSYVIKSNILKRY